MVNSANTKKLAEILGLSPRTLEYWRMVGTGPPFVKLGSRVIYDLDAVSDWIRSRSSDVNAGLES